MTRKNISKHLKAVFDKWVASITDDDVRALVKKNTIITGGSIASLLLNEVPKDYDIYFTDKETTAAVARYYVDIFNVEAVNEKAKVVVGSNATEDCSNSPMYNVASDRVKIIVPSSGVVSNDYQVETTEDVFDLVNDADNIPDKALEKDTVKEYHPIFLSSNAITLTNKIQIVVRFYGNAEEIHKNFDFVHCTNYWTSSNNQLVLSEDALESILSKNLYYVGSKYPVCSIIRTRKFIKRGWHINAGQYLKMMFQISELNLTDINVLEDQLVGVDSAYFTSLIDGLKGKLEKEPDFVFGYAYISSILDKIF